MNVLSRYWLAQRYDPTANLSDNIDEEKNRVEYIKQICTLFLSKASTELGIRGVFF